MVNLVALQMTSVPDVESNLSWVYGQLRRLPAEQTNLVVLPECFAFFGGRDGDQLALAEARYEGPISRRLKQMAAEFGCYLVSGTFPLEGEDAGHFTASSLLISPAGEVMAEYQKIHLFDVSVNDSTGSYRESKYTQAGNEVVVVDTPIGRIGMAVCYDVRFGGLFNAMGDIDILVLPAAFTRYTGEAHWHTLLRARAIEKQCFVVAAGQTGEHANNRQTYGHSIIYSPWGEVLAELPHNRGSIQAVVDVLQRHSHKANMPVGEHNRFRSEIVK
ncbi:carbon-nitrogen hydrolase family protein [Alteromonas aestuariivivens]|uniref:Carbon-nitrogen hydrolase family protein n=1 Tax=Alteromonas aestuariivivens TaxID=1938339 RepID=A0A3D8M8N1_9ALTE|nr:carbon-nitrogen hydrolase family protein [Alteromonas aestuariivivens]RDV25561.1 carbon-nitrogen hydrolase family protein [Alteromonas aestuariivivens]